MNQHPTDPVQLQRWLQTPRTGQSRADYACAIYAPAEPSNGLGGVLLAVALGIIGAALLAAWL